MDLKKKNENENDFSFKRIFKFYLKMLIVFTLLFFITSIFGGMISESLYDSKFGYEFIGEFGWLSCIAIFILIIKKGNIFTQKGIGFKKTLLISLPIILLSFSMLVTNLFSLTSFDFYKFINLILYSLSIGMVEEFLCRGWLQNKFIDKFGKNYKQVLLSIILSASIFGLMHLSNIIFQGVADTLNQVIQTFFAGVLLGAIYYRTKSIWSVVFLHAFYDFSILISELDMIKGCTTTNIVSNEVLIFELFITIIMVLFYLVSTMLIFRKDQVEPEMIKNYEVNGEDSKKTKKQSVFLWLCVGVLLVIINLPIDFDVKGYDEYYVCTEYNSKKIDRFITHYYHNDKFEINYYNKNTATNYNFELSFSLEDFEYVFYNKQTNYKIVFNKNIIDYEIIENDNDYSIILYTNESLNSLYYTKIDKNKISNDNSFLDNIKNSLIKYDLPELEQLGYLTIDSSNYKYPLMYSTLGEKFIIDENGKLFLVDNE